MYQNRFITSSELREVRKLNTRDQNNRSVSLRFVVYDFFREQMKNGVLIPGSLINVREISENLGISMTPLREALVQLETQGFVTVIPRKGVVLNGLSLRKIRNIYSIVGALEAVALRAAFPFIDEVSVESAGRINAEMRKCLNENDSQGYLDRNNRFHGLWLDRTENDELLRQIRVMKERLYEFPGNEDLIPEWEEASLNEHCELLSRIASGDLEESVRYLQFVHWDYENQEHFVRRFYSQHLDSLEKKRRDAIIHS
ncbi:MAG TPA: GntR family transcriptional regulator [Synergistaceae bacterium]|jgi:DNA-binding GntR family transcriptional regulator|nr:GntR family transcriptional regulator [Synergistaceae bacterium]